MALKKSDGYVYDGPGYELDKARGVAPVTTQNVNTNYGDVVEHIPVGSSGSSYTSQGYNRGSSDDYKYSLWDLEDSGVDDYESKYSGQIDSILNSILNKKAFDINTDANYTQLYNNAKEKYEYEGQKAMRDTMGAAQAATGGYGSTYAQAVGQQAYDDYMTGLNDQNVNLAQLAYGMYQDDIADRYNQLNAVRALDNDDYSRYRDTVSDYYTNLNYLASRYDTEYANEYNANNDAYSMAMSLASNGITVPEKYASLLDSDTVAQLNALASKAKVSGSKSGSTSGSKQYTEESSGPVEYSTALRLLQAGESKAVVEEAIKEAETYYKQTTDLDKNSKNRALSMLAQLRSRNNNR